MDLFSCLWELNSGALPTEWAQPCGFFPPSWKMAFSCLCIFPSFPQTAADHTLVFTLPVLVSAPKLSQWIYEKGPESSSFCGRMPGPIHSQCALSNSRRAKLWGENSSRVNTFKLCTRGWTEEHMKHHNVIQPNARPSQNWLWPEHG